MKLYHCSPCYNRDSILMKGLLMGMPSSGYGETPMFNGVYLYHEDNTCVPNSIKYLFEDYVDVYEVDVTGLEEYFMPDEDSREVTWEESLNHFGTLCVMVDIPPSRIKLVEEGF